MISPNFLGEPVVDRRKLAPLVQMAIEGSRRIVKEGKEPAPLAFLGAGGRNALHVVNLSSGDRGIWPAMVKAALRKDQACNEVVVVSAAWHSVITPEDHQGTHMAKLQASTRYNRISVCIIVHATAEGIQGAWMYPYDLQDDVASNPGQVRQWPKDQIETVWDDVFTVRREPTK